jgi:hypothetical protein
VAPNSPVLKHVMHKHEGKLYDEESGSEQDCKRNESERDCEKNESERDCKRNDDECADLQDQRDDS